MLLFGHIGITAGAVRVSDIIVSTAGSKGSHPFSWLNRLKSRISQVDYRLVMLSSLLPDFIDKPVFLLFGGISISGRGYAHGLLFNLILLIIGLVLTRYGKFGVLAVSLSSVIHLILDQIWNNPVTLFWPLLGPLSGGETSDWLTRIVYGLFNSPEVYIPEIIGLVILLLLFFRLVKRKGISSFIKGGVIT
ncbi:metal-dependent hydrolase [Chloroflexota bacterium]